MEIENVRPDNMPEIEDVADYVLACHDGNAKQAVETLLLEIEHLQDQLSTAVAAMGRGYTRGWQPTAER